ncbi:MAG: sugar isomerase domain-containing protein, partial [Terriglobia bacterium]
MTAAATYYEKTLELLNLVREHEMASIQAASEICVSSIAQGGLVFLFGSGHSRMMCEEMTPRQGCFPGFVSLVELSLSNHAAIIGSNGLRAPIYLEKYEGYAEEILKSFHFGPHDALIAVSTSGIRPVIVEMAAGARRRGMPVIAIVSRTHCQQSQPAHSSGKKLLDFADVIIDNHCPSG